jgi:GT2 family glycosyltransferase
MSDPDIRVSAVLVSYNSKEDLLKNLPSLLEATSRETDEVILVDNDSTDSTSEVVRSVFPDVRLIEAGENLGFGGAVNLAAVQARGRTLLVLNPDLRIQSQAIDALVARVDRAGGVAGPVLYEPASGKRLYGIRFDLMGLPIQSERPMPAFYVQGCALAISSALFRHIGGRGSMLAGGGERRPCRHSSGGGSRAFRRGIGTGRVREGRGQTYRRSSF